MLSVMTLRYQYCVMYKVDTKFYNNNTEFRENIDYNDLPYLTSSIKQCQSAVNVETTAARSQSRNKFRKPTEYFADTAVN